MAFSVYKRESPKRNPPFAKGRVRGSAGELNLRLTEILQDEVKTSSARASPYFSVFMNEAISTAASFFSPTARPMRRVISLPMIAQSACDESASI